jgi:cytochrome c553
MATNMKLNFVLFALSFMFNTANADSLVDGSFEKGKAISITCGACHGADGNSINPLWPNLANQHASYSVQQLTAFRDGKRMDSLMSAMVMSLSDQDIKDLSVYFENLPSSIKDIADPTTFDLGQKLYRGGNKESGVAACMACHGPAGKGNPAALYPALNGQGAMYTAKQLNDYATGTRVSIGPVQFMRYVAKKLTAEEIQAVSSYIQGLH